MGCRAARSPGMISVQIGMQQQTHVLVLEIHKEVHIAQRTCDRGDGPADFAVREDIEIHLDRTTGPTFSSFSSPRLTLASADQSCLGMPAASPMPISINALKTASTMPITPPMSV